MTVVAFRSAGGARRLAGAVVLATGLSAAFAACRSASTAAPTTTQPVATREGGNGAVAALRYQPFAAAYRVVTHGRVEQEFSGQVTSSDFTMQYFVTARLEADGVARRLTMRLDSVPVLRGTALGFSMSEAARARGATFTGTLSPTGEILGFTGSDTAVTLVQQIASRLREFLPRIPADGLRPGVTWTDTTESASSSAGLQITIRSVNRHEAAGWTERAGEPALRIESVSTYTMSGSGAQGVQRFSIDGAGVRRGQAYIGADGRYLGLTAADSSTARAVVAEMGIEIPIVQTRNDTLSVVR